MLQTLGRFAEAGELYRKALATRLKLLGDEHTDVANTKRNLASLLAATGEPEQGEALARQALQILRQFKKPDDWSIADAESILGACLRAQERYQEAEPLLVKGYRILRETRGASSIYTLQARRRIRDLYEAWGKPEQTVEYRDPAKTDTD